LVITKNSFKDSIIDTKPKIRIEDMNELDYLVDSYIVKLLKYRQLAPKIFEVIGTLVKY
jgi:hypothetical protein